MTVFLHRVGEGPRYVSPPLKGGLLYILVISHVLLAGFTKALLASFKAYFRSML